MCGISGVINKNNYKIEKEDIKTINDLISHRGPDDEGFYFEKNFAFGHRRLSILDLSSEGHQPMHYLDKYVITYNGEVYNYLEIKEELQKDGYTFHSHTDTEVILASYDKWGEDCVNRFNGMWAFAIYDKEKNIIFCSRDRFGVKPFYYTETDNKFVFGSEIKQLLEFYEDRYVNKKVLINYLVIGYENYDNETFFENIFKLQQSHNLIYDLSNNTFVIKRYYDIKKETLNLKEYESIDSYKKELFESIKLRLRSDVKVGTCLSGGLDSSSIAGIASLLNKKVTDEKFVAIHAKSTEKKSDESAFAKEVAKHCNLELNIIEPSKEDFADILDEVIYTQEEPFRSPSIIMQYFVMKKSKDIGCTVLLDGQGGDETLLGYERYYPAYLLDLNFFEMIKAFFNSSKNSKLTKLEIIKYFFYFTNSKIRIERLKRKNSFFKNNYMENVFFSLVQDNAKNYLNIFDLQYEELYKTQLPQLLKYEDRNSMRNSIETRLPFIDYKVVEKALSINNKFKINQGWTKNILRKSVEGILPFEVIWRKNKMGFEAPEKTWLEEIDSDIKNIIKKSDLLKKISKEIPYELLDLTQKWKLFNVAKWEIIYKVKIR
ncbi:asparagine synthase (glutamine-hydrolyzing) [Aliarcobacter butzleri]|uniref:asparagine synthase (glutamine-hydrolyzing) n=1 Tax=Aliarcobacter butzleri TaxID=28197 RepID=UPI001ED9EC62|nr:asparagine synthase (glutamine-hydrolyzing) [Aliarcobacter butzleri]MCG3677398.1 asparagine synthase (glutamine-hydrolyzing) [Aliarcobacter butzleri]